MTTLEAQRRALLASGIVEPSDEVLDGRPGEAAWTAWLADGMVDEHAKEER